jgi:hypothetical protein
LDAVGRSTAGDAVGRSPKGEAVGRLTARKFASGDEFSFFLRTECTGVGIVATDSQRDPKPRAFASAISLDLVDVVLGASLWPLPDVRGGAHADDRDRTVGSIDRRDQRAVIVAMHDELGTRAMDDTPE